MNLQDYRKGLKKDPEVIAAEKELKPILDLADQVLRLRLERGWSQEELARRVGTRQSNISRLENGSANPTCQFLKKLAGAFDTELKICLQEQQEPEYVKILPVIVEKSPWDVQPNLSSWERTRSKQRKPRFEFSGNF